MLVKNFSVLFLYLVIMVFPIHAQNSNELEIPMIPELSTALESKPALDIKSKRTRKEQVNQDTIIIATQNVPDPIKAALLSAVLPGLGQIYNKSYWKVPLVYGSLMTTGYLVHYFDYNYIKFRNAFLANTDGNPNTTNPYADNPRINDNNRLFNRVEFYRRNRDYLMIITAGVYLLNIMEAHVDAHLQTFDLTDDISMNIGPGIISTPFTTQIGLSLNINLK